MAPVAALLTARGHRVHWAANDTVAYVRRSGATLHRVLADGLSEDWQEFRGASAREIDRWFLEQWFVPIAEQALNPTLDVAREVNPDLLICDLTALWGPMVADAIRTPWATYCPGLFMSSQARDIAIRAIQHQQPLNWATSDDAPESIHWAIERRLNALRRSLHLPAEVNLSRVSDSLVLCFTTRAIELNGAGLPDQARCVGTNFASPNDIDPFDGHQPILPPGEEPLAFVTLGRVQARLSGLLQPALEALDDLEMRTLVAETKERPRLAASSSRIVFAGGPISQAQLLDRAAVVLGSGGFNTVHEALCHGVPVVALPVAGDEPALADRIDELGLGITIAESERDRASIRDAVARVVGDEGYRERAHAFAIEARLSNGASKAVRLLEALQRDGAVQRSGVERTLEELPTRPRLAPRFQLVDRGCGIALTSYTEDLEVADRSSADAVRWLYRTVDAKTPTADLLERWDGDVTLLPVIGGLVRQGVLEESIGEPRMSQPTEDRYRDQITLFSHAHGRNPMPRTGSRGVEFQERLLAARVTVVGAGILGSNVARNLCLSGVGSLVLLDDGRVDEALISHGGWFSGDSIGATRVDALASMATNLRPDLEVVTNELPNEAILAESLDASVLGDPHLVIVSTDTFETNLYRWIDEICQRKNIQWTSLRRNRMTVELGPTVIPKQTACFRCYELRRAGNLPEELGLGRTHAGWYYVPAGADWVALEAIKLLSGFGEAVTIGRIMIFDPLALTLAPHRVLRVPTCPRCKINPHVPPKIPWVAPST
jgi:bacteriocin biosynthesis cyclodehydratase domain-containing protein